LGPWVGEALDPGLRRRGEGGAQLLVVEPGGVRAEEGPGFLRLDAGRQPKRGGEGPGAGGGGWGKSEDPFQASGSAAHPRAAAAAEEVGNSFPQSHECLPRDRFLLQTSERAVASSGNSGPGSFGRMRFDFSSSSCGNVHRPAYRKEKCRVFARQ